MKNHIPMNLQLFADPAPAAETETTQPTPDGADNQPGGDGGQKQPGAQAETPVTLTQAQLDALIDKAFARGAAKGEKKAAKPASEPAADTQPADNSALETEKAKTLQLERCFSAVAKGIPADKADRYVKLAETYIGEDDDFGKALEAAIADFPLPRQFSPPAGGMAGMGGASKQTTSLGKAAAERARAREQNAAKAAELWTKH